MKVVLIGEHRYCRRPASFVATCNRAGIEIVCKDAFTWRRLLDLGDDGRLDCGQRSGKRATRRDRGLRLLVNTRIPPLQLTLFVVNNSREYVWNSFDHSLR